MAVLDRLFRRRAPPAPSGPGSVIGAADAMARVKANPRARWHSGDEDEPGRQATDASRRLRAAPAAVAADAPGPKLRTSDPVFTMGSCFARELERSLIRRGGNVVNIDYAQIDRPEFRDANGRAYVGYFHRYTPQSMLQEFRRAFGELDGWSDERSLLFKAADAMLDWHFCWLDHGDNSLQAALARRRLAAGLTRRAAEARLIVLTLGLTESWLHRPSGFWCNKVSLPRLVRRPEEYELHLTDTDQAIDCLERIEALIARRHRTGDFQLVVTVSPVPLQVTFTGRDIVVANQDSKATLRAAAAAFCRGRERIRYFPSYEMVTHSDPAAVLRADRAHVQTQAVDAIMSAFMDDYFEEGSAGMPARPDPPGLILAD
jgi:hypothetical protein